MCSDMHSYVLASSSMDSTSRMYVTRTTRTLASNMHIIINMHILARVILSMRRHFYFYY